MSTISMLITCAVLANGCGISWLASRDTNPIIAVHTTPTFFFKRSTSIFGTTASRRVITVTETSDGKFLTCAEPPPDVGESFASAIAAGLQGAVTATQGSGPTVTGELATQYGRAVATQIAPLLYRTQGLQLYRDSIYKLCIDKMNNWISDAEYLAAIDDRCNKAILLIEKEMPVMQETAKAFYASVKPGEGKVNVDDIVKILEAQKKVATSPPADSQKPSPP
jgi:hypothetical protein